MAGFVTQGHKGDRKRRTKRTSLGLPADITLFDLDHPPGRVYLVRSGFVQLSSNRGNIVDYLGPGDFFGEKSFLAPARKGQVARTVSAATLSEFRQSDLLNHMARDRRFARQVLRNLALRLDRYEEALGTLIQDTAERRLARLLWRFAPDGKGSGFVQLPFGLTNRELARAIGTTRWRVSHFMSGFQRLGWLQRQDGLWVHREKLGEYLGLS